MEDLLILGGDEISGLLEGREQEMVSLVRRAYELHRNGADITPPSSFLRFPDQRNRIIALPALIEGARPAAGLKWVASFPGNLERGLERASAVIILNCPQTGLPLAVLEGSIISAQRTAASAALAAVHLHQGRRPRLGLIGCGRINFEIARFMQAVLGVHDLYVHDIQPQLAQFLADRLSQRGLTVEILPRLEDVLAAAPLISVATTAATPYINTLAGCTPESTFLNISLRDFAADVVLHADNVVDDLDHVCRENTSIHLAALRSGHRDFVRCTLADVTTGSAPSRREPKTPVLFSPFGLGLLDLIMADTVVALARESGAGQRFGEFQPTPWVRSGASSGAR